MRIGHWYYGHLLHKYKNSKKKFCGIMVQLGDDRDSRFKKHVRVTIKNEQHPYIGWFELQIRQKHPNGDWVVTHWPRRVHRQPRTNRMNFTITEN